MNKTININLGGYFFHIDEGAYQKLRRYLDAIARSLSDDPQGKNEIISDIEARISELLSEKITDARQVVNEQDINDIIKIMGEPEDYSDTEESYSDSGYQYTSRPNKTKKLFRDSDDKFLGGVAAGIGHYFDVDVIWIRLAFILLFITGGFGVFLYILLWVLLPEARTTAEKLQMEGEPVNINNIEKKIREEFNNVKEKIKEGADTVSEKFSNAEKKYKPKAKSGFQEFLDTLGNIITAIFKVFGKFIGVIIIIVSASVLISFVLAMFSIGSFEILGISDEYTQLPPFMYDSILPHWLLAITTLVLVGVPFIILFTLGLRILSSNVKRLNKATSLSLLGIWIVALLIGSFALIENLTSYTYKGSNSETKTLTLQPTDTLNIQMYNNEEFSYSSRVSNSDDRSYVFDDDVQKIYSNDVKVDVEKSKNNSFSVKIRKLSQGRKKQLANQKAADVEYEYEMSGKELTLNNYLLSTSKNIFLDERVYVTIFVPENGSVHFDKNTRGFLSGIRNVNKMSNYRMATHYFIMTDEGLDCTDCEEKKKKSKQGVVKDSIN
jgi:phage shock protein PspC (stress-responsive transcriptional regulator)